MLHCPRCSGALTVLDTAGEISAEEKKKSACCPAGDLCPAGKSKNNMISSQQQSPQPAHRAAAYLSGGIVSQQAAAQQQQQQQASQPLFPSTQTMVGSSSGGVLLPNMGGDASSGGSSPPQLLSQSLSSQLLNLNLQGLQQQESQQKQQQHQRMLFSTTLAPCGQQFTTAPAINVLAPQQQQQQQLLQQQQQLQLQQQIQELQQQQLLLAQQQQQQQQQLLAASAAPFSLHTPTPSGAMSTPLLLTSTIQPQVGPVVAISTSLCAPPTPAIVVGSTGMPFFAPNQLLQAQQQQPVSLTIPPTMTPVAQHPPTGIRPPSPASPTPAPSAAAIKEVLEVNRAELLQCGWYYPGLRWDESAEVLRDAEAGAFLIRDSQDSRFLYSLSVQRSPEEGPTSVRIHFQGGKFKLDAEDAIRDLMPSFRSVVSLIEHYLGLTGSNGPSIEDSDADKRKGTNKQVWVDSVGKISSPIMLRRPKYKEVPSLAHFARLSTHRRLQEVGKEAAASEQKAFSAELPVKLREYVASYPHRV